jgi:hypothetical protein
MVLAQARRAVASPQAAQVPGGILERNATMVDYTGKTLPNPVTCFETSMTLHGNKNFGTINMTDGTMEAYGTNWNIVGATINLNTIWRSGTNIINIEGQTDPNHLSYDHVQLFVNDGTINSSAGSNTYINGKTAGATLANSGKIHVGSLVKIDATVTGSGTMDFIAPAVPLMGVPGVLKYSTLELDRGVSADQKINMHNDGKLVIGDLGDFHAVIQEFTGLRHFNPNKPNLVSQDVIDLKGRHGVSGVVYNGNQNGGVLTVFNSLHAVAGTINFAGDYTHAHFSVVHNGGDSLIRLT